MAFVILSAELLPAQSQDLERKGARPGNAVGSGPRAAGGFGIATVSPATSIAECRTGGRGRPEPVINRVVSSPDASIVSRVRGGNWQTHRRARDFERARLRRPSPMQPPGGVGPGWDPAGGGWLVRAPWQDRSMTVFRPSSRPQRPEQTLTIDQIALQRNLQLRRFRQELVSNSRIGPVSAIARPVQSPARLPQRSRLSCPGAERRFVRARRARGSQAGAVIMATRCRSTMATDCSHAILSPPSSR